MAETGSYRNGRILYAYLRSTATGKKERHPAIVLDATDDIVQPERFDPRNTSAQNAIHVIGVSTKHKIYATEYVQLPFSPSGHSTTRLREDCGAIIGWYHRIAIPDDVIGFGGDVPAATMFLIDSAIRKDLAKKIGGELGTLTQVFEELLGTDE